MKFIGLDGKEFKINLVKYSKIDIDRPRSSGHLRARELLKKEFPSRQILEEVYIESEKLFIDFLITGSMVAVEIQGQQHFEFSSFMHGTVANFKKSQYRDKCKREFCTVNNIILIELPDNESEQQWVRRIRDRYRNGTTENASSEDS